MNKALSSGVISRLGAIKTALQRVRQPKRSASDVAHHGHDFNAGPPITYDYWPIPCQPYQKIYGELQKKFNMYLIMSSVVFAGSVYLCIYMNAFNKDCFLHPDTYRYRNHPEKLIKNVAKPSD